MASQEGVALNLKSCEDVRPLLVDRFYGELSAEETETCLSHLAVCPECRKAADDLTTFLTMFNRLRLSVPDRPEMEEVLHWVKKRLAFRRRMETIFFAAISAAFLGLFWVGLAALDPRLPLYFHIGITLNLYFFYLPIHLSRRGKEGRT